MPEPRAEFVARLPRKVAAAGALITDADSRVLVVKPTYKAGWEIPGEVVEDGEPAPAACGRELVEELQLPIPVGRLLVVEHQTAPDDKGDSIMFVYDAGVLAGLGTVRLPPDELEAVRFASVEELPDLLPTRLLRRVVAALRARREDRVIELVDGVEVAPG